MKNLGFFLIFLIFPFLAFSQAIVFHEDFEGTSSSFSTSSTSGSATPWQVTSSLSNSGSFADSNNVQLSDTVYLTSQAFSTQRFTELTLSFSHIAKIYLFDRAVVEVSADNGNTWIQLGSAQYMGSGFMNSNSFSSLSYSTWAPANNSAVPNNSWWKEEKFNIDTIGRSTNARIRFTLIDTDNNGSRGNYGWLIDDVVVTSPGINRPHTYLYEDFNSGIPTGWSNNAISGSFDWMHGSMFDVDENLTVNIDGTSMVYFNDDSLGTAHSNNTVELISPVLSPVPNVPLFLDFDYNFRDYKSGADFFKVEIFDGSNWVVLKNINSDDCGRWAPCAGKLPKAHVNITNYINDQLKVKFTYHDGNDWSYWATFDNVHIYSPNSYYPIGAINKVDAMGVADSLYVKAWISGTVAGVDLDNDQGYSFTLIDQSAALPEGIHVLSFDNMDSYVVNEGDSILVYGIVEQSNGLQQFRMDSIVQLSSNTALPWPTTVSVLDESTESKLIQLENYSVAAVAGNYVALTKGMDTLWMKVEESTDVDDNLSFSIGDEFCFINGIGGQYDTLNPYFDGYYFTPRYTADVGLYPTIDLGRDTTVCASAGYTLDAGPGFVSYFWNTNDQSQSIQVSPSTDSLYIVAAIDAEGCIATDTVIVEVDICTGLEEMEDNIFEIYPNPSNGIIFIKTNSLHSPLSVEVFDFSGKSVFGREVGSTTELEAIIDLTHLSKGIYLLQLKTKELQVVHKIALQ